MAIMAGIGTRTARSTLSSADMVYINVMVVMASRGTQHFNGEPGQPCSQALYYLCARNLSDRTEHGRVGKAEQGESQGSCSGPVCARVFFDYPFYDIFQERIFFLVLEGSGKWDAISAVVQRQIALFFSVYVLMPYRPYTRTTCM